MANDEAALSIAELKKHEQLAEAAYDAMYDATGRMAKDCYEDACSHFSEAIDVAKRASLEDEVKRLTIRRDHVIAVYVHQFRGVG